MKRQVHSMSKMETHFDTLFGTANMQMVEVKKSKEVVAQSTKIIQHADVTFIIGENKLSANKSILSLVSPVFEKMFTSDFEEKSQAEIELPGKNYKDMLNFIAVTHTFAPISFDNIYGVVPIAHEYQCGNVLKYLENLLVQMFDNIKHYNVNLLMQTLGLAGRHELQVLREMCLKASFHIKLKAMKQTKSYESIPLETLKLLLEQNLSLRE